MSIILKTALSATLIATTFIAIPSQAADEWQTLSPSDCHIDVTTPATRPREGRDYSLQVDGGIRNAGVNGVSGRTLAVTCNIPRTTIDDNVLKVYINHVNGNSISDAGPTSAGGSLVCTLTASAYNNPAMTNSAAIFNDQLGFHSSYGEVLTFGWGPASLNCVFPTSTGVTDVNSAILKNISYK